MSEGGQIGIGATLSRTFRISILWLMTGFYGCAHPIAENLRHEADPALTFARAYQSPESYVGSKIILGGVIVKTTNLPESAEIEVVQKEVNSFGNVVDSDVSGGRFLFVLPGYVEPEIYTKGRKLVGFGKIAGSKMGKVDDRDYRYPVIEVEDLHLWERADPYRYYGPYDYPPFYYGYSWGRSPLYWSPSYGYPWRRSPFYW